VELLEAARGQLRPLFDALMTELEARDNSFAQAFFGRARQQLERLEDEADLAGLFCELSSAAFHCFEFLDHRQRQRQREAEVRALTRLFCEGDRLLELLQLLLPKALELLQ